MIIEINGQRVEVDDGFANLTPEQQNATVDEIAQSLGRNAPANAQQERGFMDAVKDNIIGVDDGVNSPGEQIGQAIRGAGAAVARGIADVPALPANILQLGALGVERLAGMEEPSAVSRGLNSLPDTRDMLASVPVIGPESQYRAPGLLGDYISTAGEFAGGAGAMSGAGNMVRFGLLPGAASESAGQATEGTAAEPYARAGAGLAMGLLATPRSTPFAGSDEGSRMANVLSQNGVRGITAGQARGNQNLMRAEGRLQATNSQIDDFTASTMRQLGSTEKLATPQNLRAVEQRLVQQMDDALQGVSISPTPQMATMADDIGRAYIETVPAGQLTPRIRGIADEIIDRATSPNSAPIDLTTVKRWRTSIGKLSVSPDAATREAAHSLRSLLDDMTDTALTGAGRQTDIQSLSQARESYRNFIAVRDAASRAGAEGGTLSPQALNQSVIRSQGREAYATGRTTDMAEFTRAGAAVLRPASTVQPGGVRRLMDASPLVGGALAGGAGLQSGANPLSVALMVAAGAAAPSVGQASMRSGLLQTLMKNPRATKDSILPILPGLLGN